MPRTTHPTPKGGHSRAHVRQQRDRWINKRWKRLKNGRKGGDYWFTDDREREQIGGSAWHRTVGPKAPEFTHPDDIQGNAAGYPFAGPFTYERNKFSRNWETYCSCMGCSGRYFDQVPRSRTQARWQSEWEAEINDPSGDDDIASGYTATRSMLREIAGGW